MAEPKTFEQLLREAATKKADVRVKPHIDPRSGCVAFVAHLYGVRGEAIDCYCNGVLVLPDPNAKTIGE